jgi:hypothetical protein
MPLKRHSVKDGRCPRYFDGAYQYPKPPKPDPISASRFGGACGTSAPSQSTIQSTLDSLGRHNRREAVLSLGTVLRPGMTTEGPSRSSSDKLDLMNSRLTLPHDPEQAHGKRVDFLRYRVAVPNHTLPKPQAQRLAAPFATSKHSHGLDQTGGGRSKSELLGLMLGSDLYSSTARYYSFEAHVEGCDHGLQKIYIVEHRILTKNSR